ncbi:MAG: hypothetical protein WC994_09680 [Brumimicrobium sp.]
MNFLNKLGKFEVLLLILVNVIFFMGKGMGFLLFPYIFLSTFVALYFSPLKILMLIRFRDAKRRYYKIFVSLLISTTLVLSAVSMLNPSGDGIRYFAMFLAILNVILLFKWRHPESERKELYLLCFNVFLLAGIQAAKYFL